MRIATFAAAFLLTASAAFAQAPSSTPASSKPASVGPIQLGTYDIELAIGGGTLAGTLELKPAGDSLTAVVSVGDHAPPPIKSVKRNGAQLGITAGDAGVNVVYDLKFTGDALSGTFTFNGDPGFVTGKRRK